MPIYCKLFSSLCTFIDRKRASPYKKKDSLFVRKF